MGRRHLGELRREPNLLYAIQMKSRPLAFAALALAIAGSSQVHGALASPTESERDGLERAIQKALDRSQFTEASRLANLTLDQQPRSPEGHLLNALAYEGLAAQDAAFIDLAAMGYRRVLALHPGHAFSARRLARLELLRGSPQAAWRTLGDALAENPSDPHLLLEAATAAYLAGDPGAALDLVFGSDGPLTPVHLRLVALSAAAVGEFELSDEAVAGLAATDGQAATQIAPRLAFWRSVYASAGEELLQEPLASSAATAPPVKPTPKMVVVEVVIISTEESETDARGINLLNGLALQLGEFGRPALQAQWRSSPDPFGPNGQASSPVVMSGSISIPAITYSLNIVNAGRTRSKVLARPSLVVTDGEKSSFFSGLQIQAATSDGGALGQGPLLIERDIGMSLEVTPRIQSGSIRMTIVAERTYLRAPSSSVEFSYRLETTKTRLNATVEMEIGQTLVLSGLTEREESEQTHGLPGIERVPGVRRIFSRDVRTVFEKSVVVLLTPKAPDFIAAAPPGEIDRQAQWLRARQPDRFQKYGKWRHAVNRLGDTLPREFRSRDINLEAWPLEDAIKAQLPKAVRELVP